MCLQKRKLSSYAWSRASTKTNVIVWIEIGAFTVYPPLGSELKWFMIDIWVVMDGRRMVNQISALWNRYLIDKHIFYCLSHNTQVSWSIYSSGFLHDCFNIFEFFEIWYTEILILHMLHNFISDFLFNIRMLGNIEDHHLEIVRSGISPYHQESPEFINNFFFCEHVFQFVLGLSFNILNN